MAVEQRIHDNGFMVAAADLSAKKFRCVKVSGDFAVNICGVAGEQAYGVLQNIPASGQVANVRDLGISRVIVGTGGLTAGQKWMTDGNGAAVLATTGKHAVGIVLQGAIATEIATVTVGYGVDAQVA